MAIKTPQGEVHDSGAISASITDPERFAEIVHRHWDEIYRYVARRLGPETASPAAPASR